MYPGESAGPILPLQVVQAMTALKLQVLQDFEETDGAIKRFAGDEYLFEGPGTYIPRKEVTVVSTVESTIIYNNEALKMRAVRSTVDRDGVDRVAGEEWMVRKTGPYLPGVYEKVVEKIKATILTDTVAVHVVAKQGFKDQLGKTRKNGEEYLITHKDMETFIPDVHEQVKEEVSLIL